MILPPTYLNSSNGYIRKRSSLVEALNNSLFLDGDHNQSDDIKSDYQYDFERESTNQRCPSNRATIQDKSSSNKAKRIVLMRAHILFFRDLFCLDQMRQEIEELELPSHLIRKNNSNATKRSRSHPVYFPIHIDSDDESDNGSATASHISRMSAYALFSGLRTPETASSTNDHSVRSSVHSMSSSMTTSSTMSSGDEQCLLSAEAVWDHVAVLPNELPFAIGDIISVLDYSSHEEFWYGNCRERVGWFPSSYVRILNSNPSIPDIPSLSYFPQSMRFLRAKIVQELMQTERDYVNLLQNIVQGFTEQCRRRSDLFPAVCIQRLFGNIEAIYALHCKFLRELELAFNRNVPESSAIGAIFLRNRSKFSIYSEYCNNRPVSSTELALLTEQTHYYQFFEACRLLRGMPKLPLEGFLLAPVQRICRYPLQLSELLKATPTSHIDREPVKIAVSAMKNVAAMINEKKRRLEGLQQIVLWQMNVEGWRGPDLVETNSRMIHSGEVYCRYIIGGNIIWHKDVLLFLFDQSLVICKKDLIKRNFYIFRDRISLNSVTFLNCNDGRDSATGLNLKNSWKLIMMGREVVFTCKDRSSKVIWVEHLQRPLIYSPATAEERKLICETIYRTSNSKLTLNQMGGGKINGRFTWWKTKN
uniref:Bm12527; Bm9577; Bm9577 n=1 Tax=Brugia malayi TaxID=6279 RepID=A0A912GST9_BRUMA